MMDDEDLLAGIDLHTWRVPPPAAVHRPSLLVRALAPATPPTRRRITWLVAALAVVNIALASIIVILLSRPTPTPTVTVVAAGGGSVDAQVRDLLARLEQEQRELEAKLAEIKQLRVLVTELSDKVRMYEQRDRTIVKQPAPITPPIAPAPITPAPLTPSNAGCDEVGCVLGNYEGACCDKFRRTSPAPIVEHPANEIPEALDRTMISNAVNAVKPRVAACATSNPVHGTVKVRVRVDAKGRVTSVDVESAPDAALGACVASAMQRAVFGRTLTGGSFSYPFVF